MVQPLNILIIDDCPEDRQVYRRYLLQDQEYSYNILEAETGAEALTLCQQVQPDGTLLDFLLPDMDGLEFLDALQQQLPDITPFVIMLTAYGDERVAVEAMKNGVQDYLIKEQTTPERLRSTLHSAIANAQLNRELQVSGRLLQRIADTTPGILYVYDLVKQENVYINSQVYNLLGYTATEIQALGIRSITQWMHPHDLAHFANICQQFDLAQDGDVIEHEYRMPHANGTWRWFYSRSTVFTRNANGSPQQIVGTAFDITERKQIEEELRLSNERFQLATAAVNSLIYDYNVETNTVNRTEGLTRILGYTLAEAEPTFEWWQDLIHPEDREQLVKQFQALPVTANRYTFEYRVRHKDHQYHYVLDQGIIIRNQTGQTVRIVGSTTDISDRKRDETALRQSEERYRYLCEAVPQIVWICSAQGGGCEYVNQRWCEFTGQRGEAARQFGWTKFLHPDDLQPAIEKWRKVLHTGETYEHEIRYQKHDGSYSWHLARAVPIKDEQGRISKWFGTSTDIDERKQLEAERNRLLQLEQNARVQAEAANQSKDKFIAMVSHDLRSPLNAILGWAQLLLTRQMDIATITRGLETIERSAQSQSKLLEDLLNRSRILQGKLQLELGPVNLVGIIDVAMETAYPCANAKNIRLESVIDESVPMIQGDANRLLQVLGNLLSNAIKFTPSGGRVEVQLSTRGDLVVIEVSDTGIGINPEFLPHVFEPYYQGDRPDKQTGLGLGLAIAHHLVELHGGKIQVTSPGEGQGTTFTIHLPKRIYG